MLISLNSTAFYQMKNWTLPPNKVYFNFGSPPAVTALPGASSTPYLAANGAYDENNNLLFYVMDGSVYNAAGSFVAYLTNGGYPTPQREIAIVPIPGQCKKYYVIYFYQQGYVGEKLLYSTVDCSGASVVVTSNLPAQTLLSLSGNSAGIAVSKIVSGSGASAIRYLYSVGFPYVTRLTISSSGIGSAYTLLDFNAMPSPFPPFTSPSTMDPAEAELNSDGTLFAWGSQWTNKVYQISTSSPHTLTTYTISNVYGINGLEFDVNNCLWASAAGSAGGIYKITPGTTPTYTLIGGTSSYSTTHIEQTNLGYFAFVGSAGTFGYVDVGTNAFSTTALNIPITLYSNASYPGGMTVYSLPDQIDFEDYSYFSGVPKATAAFQINGATTSATCGTSQQLYNCVPITLNNQSTGAVTYTLQVNSVDASCQVVSGGSYLTYNSGSISTLPSDLRGMPGANGTWLASHTGTYRVILTASNGCTTPTSQTAYITINAAPSAATANFSINNPVTGVPCYSSNVLSPCSLCTGAPTMNIASSTGTITYYTKRTEQLISGVWTTVSGPTTVNVSGVSGATSVYVSTGGFSYTPGAQYRVTVTVGNDCGSNSKICYVVAYSCKTDGSDEVTGVVDERETGYAINLFPNPTNDNSTLTIELPERATASLVLTDLAGRNVTTVMDEQVLEAGSNSIALKTQGLPAGIYSYHLRLGTHAYSGKLVKVD